MQRFVVSRRALGARWSGLFGLVAAVLGAVPLLAEETQPTWTWTTNGNEIVVWVAAGTTNTFSDAIFELKKGSITKFTKRGRGGAFLQKNATAATRPSGWDIQVVEGTLGMLNREIFGGAIGGNTITVKNGATLYLSFYTNGTSPCLGGYNDVVAEGVGVEGTGAVYYDYASGTSSDIAFFNNFKLSGDVYVCMKYSLSFGGKLDLDGHTLTFQSKNSQPLILGGGRWTGTAPYDESKWTTSASVTPGNIVLENTGVQFVKRIDYIGDFSDSKITIKGDKKRITYRDLQTPQKFAIDVLGAGGGTGDKLVFVENSFSNGVYCAAVNVQEGAVTFKGATDANPNFYSGCSAGRPQCLTFRGPVTAANHVIGFGGYSGMTELDQFTCFLENTVGDDVHFVLYKGHWVGRKDGCFGTDAEISLAITAAGGERGSMELELGPGKVSPAYAAGVAARLASWNGDGNSGARFLLHTDEDTEFTSDFPTSSRNGYSTIPYGHSGSNTLTFAGVLPNNRTFVLSNDNTTAFSPAVTQNLYAVRVLKGELLVPPTATGVLAVATKSWNDNGCLTVAGGELALVDSAYRGVLSPEAKGMIYQTGGTISTVGWNRLYVSAAGDGEMLLRGGTVDAADQISIGARQYADYKDTPGGSGVLTLQDGNPQVTVKGTIIANERTNGFVTAVNLNSGVLVADGIHNASGADKMFDGRSYVNFNGGTYRPYRGSETDNSKYPLFGYYGNGTPTAVTVWNATFDEPNGWMHSLSSSGNGCMDEKMVFKSPTGRGLKSVTLPNEMPRTGYHGVLPVTVTGGGGTCAMAALDYDPETRTVADTMLITCPGWDYAEPPTVTAIGSDGVAYACTAVLTETDQNPGVIYKTGNGTLNLNTTSNLFTGTYVVSNGTLRIPRWANIDSACSLRLAGGMFKGDWIDARTVKTLGGYGTFEMYPNNNSQNNFTVTDALVFDARDLAAGLGGLTYSADESASVTGGRDRLFFNEGIRLTVENPAELPNGRYVLLNSPTATIPRVPELEVTDPCMANWHVRLTADKKQLILSNPEGLLLLIR